MWLNKVYKFYFQKIDFLVIFVDFYVVYDFGGEKRGEMLGKYMREGVLGRRDRCPNHDDLFSTHFN